MTGGADVRHRLALNFVWEVPYRPSSALLKGVLGRWQLNGLAIMQSGAPFTVVCTLAYPRCDFNADGVNGDRVNMPSFGTDIGSKSIDQWVAGAFTAADFPLPGAGGIGNEPRNAFRGPGFKNADISLVKNFSLKGFAARESRIQVRVGTFNAFNWVNLNNLVTATNNANFGKVTSARGGTGGPRVVQLALKYVF